MDLAITLDRTSPALLSHQIGRAIADLIGQGLIKTGARLPPTRELARQLEVARSTVVEAYGWLADQGYVDARHGAGTRVRRLDLSAVKAPPRPVPVPDEAEAVARPAIDFRPGLPDLGSFPRREWMSALARADRRLPLESLGYGEPLGHARLRRAVADYMERSRGLAVDPHNIVITAGAAQTVDIVLRVLDGCEELIIEQPAHFAMRRLTGAYGLTLREVPVDGEGLRTDLLPRDGAPRLAYVTPSHQMPMGSALSLERRSALTAWAERFESFVIEDDYDSEFTFDGRPAVPLYKLGPAGRVIYSGTFSKTLVPSLRLAFMIAPDALIERIAAIKRWADYGGWPVAQEALAQWIEDGTFERHVYRMRKLYRERYGLLSGALKAALDERVRIVGEPVGMHLVAFVESDRSAAEIETLARARGVGLYPIEEMERAFVFGFGNTPSEDIARGVKVFADAVGARRGF